MKKILFSVIITIFLLLPIAHVKAAPTPENQNVIHNTWGEHIILVEPENRTEDNYWLTLTGWDLVMARDNNGQVQQWFWNDEVGYHSVWNIKKGNCPSHAVVVENANPAGPDWGWGDYLEEGVDFCVITNQFGVN